jgi:molybdopterin-binding protein
MKLSARNMLNARVKAIHEGAVNAEVILELSDGQELVSIITMSSVKSLGLAVGKEVKAVVKASNVMVGVE